MENISSLKAKWLKREVELLMCKGISKADIASKMGFSPQQLNNTLSGARGVTDTFLDNFIDAFNINQFDLLREGSPEKQTQELTSIYKPKQPEVLGRYSVPLYDVAAAANLQTLFCNREQNILGEISIPNIPKCDGAVYISGDSMYPILKAGDIVAYKEIRDPANIIYGEMYLLSLDIEGDDYLTIKYINRSDFEQCVKLVSYNTYHEPKDIPISSIKALAIVKLSIRKNTM